MNRTTRYKRETETGRWRSLLILPLMLILSGIGMIAMEVKDVPNVHVADRTRYLSNPDGVISATAQAVADSIMGDIWHKTSAEVVAVVVNDLDEDHDIDDYATRLFEEWGIGKKDKSNGMLVVVAINDRSAVIRTGYGMEGVVPDVVASRILRNEMFPRFREGDYDGGLVATLSALSTVITDPDATEELMSRYRNDQRQSEEEDWGEILTFLLCWGGLWLVAAGTAFGIAYFKNRKDTRKAYEAMKQLKITMLLSLCVGLFIPILVYIPYAILLKKLRYKARQCPRCGGKMTYLKPGSDERWLSSGQLTERRLNSMEHDTWECGDCGYGRVESYPVAGSQYKKCPRCGFRAYKLYKSSVLRPATTLSAGEGERVYHCEHCGFDHTERYTIPRQAPVVIVPGFGGRGGGGGGGFSGGSFGGGFTGGGGASGRW